LLRYIDDLVITMEEEVEAFKAEMKVVFQMSDLGLLSFYLGIEVHQDNSGLSIRQTSCTGRIVDLGGLTSCSLAHAPKEERLKLIWDNTTEEVDAMQYQRILGSLRYLVHTQSDTPFAVSYVSRFMQQPTEEHQQAIKRILCYVVGTCDYGLHYPRCPGMTHFIGYSDSDYVGDINTNKSTSVTLFFLNKCLISRQSVKQQLVALSSCEAEYIVATTASTQAIWHWSRIHRWEGWAASGVSAALGPWRGGSRGDVGSQRRGQRREKKRTKHYFCVISGMVSNLANFRYT
jgi:hypothetical protein